MGKTSYQLTVEQMEALDDLAQDLLIEIRDDVCHEKGGCLDPIIDGKFDSNKFTAMVWYIGDKLGQY